MQNFEISGAVRPIYGSLGVKRLRSRKSGGSLKRRTVTPHFGRILFNIILTYRRALSVSHSTSFKKKLFLKLFSLLPCFFTHPLYVPVPQP